MKTRDLVVSLGVALGVVVIGILVVSSRSSSARTGWFSMSPDAKQYIRMVQGQPAEAPYKFRVLVPQLAALLPLPPDQALRVVTYASLFGCNIFILLSLGALKMPMNIRISSLLSLALTPGHLLLYQNPQLTDAFGLMCLSAMMYSVIRKTLPLFLLSSVAGILGRESTIVGIPGWLGTKRYGQLLGALLLGTLTYLLPRALMGGSWFNAFISPTLTTVAKAYLTLGFAWVGVVAGFVQGASNEVRVNAAFVVAGAVVSSLVAVDTVRMFTICWPVAVLLYAAFLCPLRLRIPVALPLSLVLFALLGLTGVPTIFTQPWATGMTELEQWYRRLKYPILLVQGVGLLCMVVFTVSLIGSRARAEANR